MIERRQVIRHKYRNARTVGVVDLLTQRVTKDQAHQRSHPLTCLRIGKIKPIRDLRAMSPRYMGGGCSAQVDQSGMEILQVLKFKELTPLNKFTPLSSVTGGYLTYALDLGFALLQNPSEDLSEHKGKQRDSQGP